MYTVINTGIHYPVGYKFTGYIPVDPGTQMSFSVQLCPVLILLYEILNTHNSVGHIVVSYEPVIVKFGIEVDTL